jgi:polar amino acid transport system substrate-binding protein
MLKMVMREKLAPLKLASLLLGTLGTLAWLGVQPLAQAGEVLQHIEQTATLTAGVRKDAIPFGYVDEQGEWVGYSLDILELIRQSLSDRLGRPISLTLVEVTPQNRFELVETGAIQIECGTTTFTWAREERVDFSLSYFPNGTQMLVPADSEIWSIPSLAGQRIGAIPNTTNDNAIRSLQPQAQMVAVADRYEGFRQLQQGTIDGFASDGITLEGLRRLSENPEAWEVVPDLPFVLESYACMVPQDESEWRDLVNITLTGFMQGVVGGDGEMAAIYDRWFGETGVTPYSRELVTNYFFSIVNVLEWIPTVDSWAD